MPADHLVLQAAPAEPRLGRERELLRPVAVPEAARPRVVVQLPVEELRRVARRPAVELLQVQRAGPSEWLRV